MKKKENTWQLLFVAIPFETSTGVNIFNRLACRIVVASVI